MNALLDLLDFVRGKRCLCGYLLRSPREQENGLCMDCRMRRAFASLRLSGKTQQTGYRASLDDCPTCQN
jgi:hypothetical protein